MQQDFSENNHQEIRNNKISPRELLLKYLPFAPWVFLSVLVFLTGAYIKLRYSPNIYSVSGTLMIREENQYGSGTEKFDEIFSPQSSRSLSDEMQVIRSRNMAKRVVKSLGLEIQYFNQGKIRSSLVYQGETPIRLKVLSLTEANASFVIPVTILNDREFKLSENGAPILFDQPFEIQAGRFTISKTATSYTSFGSPQFFISGASPEQRAVELVAGLSANAAAESDNIMQLTFLTESPKAGMDIVNQWMKEYQNASLEDKRQIAVNALKFIDDQMDTVRQDLMGVEKNLQGYREKNKIYSPEQQSQNNFSSLVELENQITSKGVQLENVDYLINYINNNQNQNRQVVSLLNITEPTLLKQIGDFNDLQVQRETALKTTTSENPLVKNIDAAIDKLRKVILQNLQNVKQSYTIELNNYKVKSANAGKEVSLIPLKEKQLLDISRRQKILEELFSYLLQKKLETSISSASTISNIRVIEPASSSEKPVMPNRNSTFLIAFFLGLGLPAAMIFLKEFLNDKVRSRDDIQKATTAPIIGEVGHSEEINPLVVSRTSRRFIAEQFRIIRTNLEYFLPKSGKQTILVTSSTSGEGKSFMSANIGAVLAITGKKTVIMEFDIRKPKVAASLNVKHKTGISNFVIGKSEFDDIVVPVPSVENLYIIPCGPVPPNPSELLVGEKISELIEKAKERFDVIVMDTAPAGLVSDPIILGKFANVAIYVIRHNHTFKKQLNLLNEIYKGRRLPGLSLVVNDIKSDGTYGYYDGYAGYGYTGYGYGSEYFEDKVVNKSFANKVKRIFKKSFNRN